MRDDERAGGRDCGRGPAGALLAARLGGGGVLWRAGGGVLWRTGGGVL